MLMSALAVLAAYLIGAIPFGYLMARWIKGIDIRTVGSGNIGATNVGRVMGLPFFFLVFGLDMLKGLVPTLVFPLAVTRATGQSFASLSVLVALATIIGHNFPIYLGFRGGKGVATTFGALFVLDAIAMLSAGISFVVFLLITRYVSLSSLLAGLVFATVHFRQFPDFWGGDHIAMSLATIGLLVLLLVRHRKNLARIHAGTEPKVSFRKKTATSSSGRVALRVVLVLAGLGILGGLAICVARRPSLDCGSYTLRAATRMRTGLQRAERLAFADEERLLAVTCPRYNRVVLTRIVEETLTPWKEIALEGRPVALWPTSDRLYVLERPIADAHHVEAGWCEAFDFAGKPVGSRIRVGFDPDDLIVTADGRWGLVLTSGNAEGESQRPDPALIVIDLAASRDEPKVRARLVFDRKGDDPVRLALAPDERRAAVSLLGSDTIAWIDLSDRERPRIIGRSDLAMPGALTFNAHGHLIAASSAPGLWLLTGAGIAPKPLPMDGAGGDVIALDILQGHVACTVPQDSSLEVLDPDASRRLGRLPIRGTANLGTTRPIGLAFAPRRGLLAVANRQGGSVHLLSVERKTVAAQDQRAVASAGSALNRK